MDDSLKASVPEGKQEDAIEADLTGRSRMTRNILASWAIYVVYLVGGFVMPRSINDQIGKEALGVWYFGWSLLAHFSLISRMMGSTGRYVARYRAMGDMKLLNVTVSTGLMIYLCAGAVVVAFAISATMLLPAFCADKLAEHMNEAQWVVCLLGLSLAVRLTSAIFVAVLTGCHRWIAHNIITSGTYLVSVSAMLFALVVLGKVLRTMAAITLAADVLAAFVRMAAAYRVCPGMRISIGAMSWRQTVELTRFGGKTLVLDVSSVLSRETTRVMILAHLGPAALALYSIPLALVRHTMAIMGKFAHVFAPTASAFDAKNDSDSLRDLLAKGSRYALYICLPMVIVLVVSGSGILRVWMRDKEFAQGLVLAILAVGHLAYLSQTATMQILIGMGRHGVPAIVTLAGAIFGIPLTALALGPLDWGLVGAAFAVALPLTLAYGVVIPLYVCHLLKISWARYFGRAAPGPVLVNCSFAVCLLALHWIWEPNTLVNLLAGLGISGVVLAVLYWKYAIPTRLRAGVKAATRCRRPGVRID